jgi:hypothetical protein
MGKGIRIAIEGGGKTPLLFLLDFFVLVMVKFE